MRGYRSGKSISKNNLASIWTFVRFLPKVLTLGDAREGAVSDDLIVEGVLDAHNGAAVCFIGAGFSLGASTAQGFAIPSVSELTAEIWDIIGDTPDPNASLSDLADFCEQDDIKSGKLRDLLISRFTYSVPTKSQKQFLEIPWRAVFTTNFDDIPEIILPSYQIVTPTFNVKNLNPAKHPIYYLHGRARDLLEAHADPSIILSETSYLQIKEKNRDLYAAISNEIHAATKVFFIGYSLRDAEIASILFSTEGLRGKSIVVVGGKESKISLRRLDKFGSVYPIGLSGLVATAERVRSSVSHDFSITHLNFVEKISHDKVADEVLPDDVQRLILSGEFSFPAYARHIADGSKDNPYCVSREKHIESVFSAFGAGVNRVLVSSDLGNGKSIFLDEISYTAHQKGYVVYRIARQLREVYRELDALLADPRRKLFIIDDLIRYRKIAEYIGKRLPSSSAIIVSSGTINDMHGFANISSELSGTVREVDINFLNQEELVQWDRFLERWGFWEERIEDAASERIKFLRERCSSENRAIVVSLFKTSALSNKIHAIVDFFLNRNKDLSRPFIAILINSLCRHHVEWPRIVEWLGIDEGKLKSAILSSRVVDFISGSRRWYDFTSAELADFILSRYNFEIDDIVDVYVKIVKETAYSANDPRSGFDARENLKELMRFRFLTRLFSSQEDGHPTINAVYHRLSSVPRIRDNDQFWLQYAMARMEIGDLASAETYINTSLGIARKKGLDYSLRQILDQRSRLLFRKNTQRRVGYAKADVTQAVADLTEALNDHDELITHPLRASADVLAFVEAKIDELHEETISELKQCLALMRSKIPDGKLPKSQKGETRKIRDDVFSALTVLSNY